MAETSKKTAADKAPKEKLPPLSARLKKLGLIHDWDYVLHLPLRYEDLTSVIPIAHAPFNTDCQVQGTVVTAEETGGWKKQFRAVIRDDTGCMTLRFIHYYPSTVQNLKEGTRVRAFGQIKDGYYGPEMIHPKIAKVTAVSEFPATLTPVYPATQGVTQPMLRKRIDRALLDVDLKDLLTEEERDELEVPRLTEALKSLHHPAPGADLESLQNRTSPGWRRLKFDELLAQQIMLSRARELRDNSNAPKFQSEVQGGLVSKLIASLPFKLTGAQMRCWGEIREALQEPKPMNRLVQGDVGSGKTVIAALAACLAIDNGMQAAFMAPTEILAEQHFRKILAWLEPLGVEIVWLSGKLKTKEKNLARERIAAGAQIVVGTHALIQPTVKFKNLGLAIVDEQHRFGVLQRLALRSETENGIVPHLLMLSATPIPRTLAMSYLADLDVSVIDELPPGRTPIQTSVISQDKIDELVESLRRQLKAGVQAYWVCPLVEESEKIDLTAAVARFESLKEALPEFEIELIHGQMPPEEKAHAMDRFSGGEVSLLVATTVIEVGVDVPNASIMIIEHSERFGLSQLHQLRGRVGRGSKKSFCLALFGHPISAEGRERLNIFREHTDGFEIARLDLQMRGPGEFLGSRQSGVPLLRFADIDQDTELLEASKEMARVWIENKDPRAETHASRWYRSRENYLEA